MSRKRSKLAPSDYTGAVDVTGLSVGDLAGMEFRSEPRLRDNGTVDYYYITATHYGPDPRQEPQRVFHVTAVDRDEGWRLAYDTVKLALEMADADENQTLVRTGDDIAFEFGIRPPHPNE